jgi:hydroxypyruvate reductase
LQGLDARQLLLECMRAALDAVDARACVERQLEGESLTGDWNVVAIGKAAGAMTQGVRDFLGDRLAAAMVVTKPGHCPEQVATDSRVRLLESAHPIPDERSLAAGQAVADFVSGLPASAQVLFLVSGGASSLVDLLAPGVTLEELQEVNSRALGAGVAIDEINARRRALSRLKGGGLAVLAGRRRSLALMISDVPGDDPTVIGSGLLHGAGGDWAGASPAMPYRIVASVRQACRAAGQCGAVHGLKVRIARGRFRGSAALLGRRFAHAAGRADEQTLQVWGGESTVRLPAHPGTGGRNQHLALSAAIAFADESGVALLAAGTDGIDGVTDDAGGLVDGATCERGAEAGLDARACLARADSGTFLEAAGDLVHTGPTLTNVGDLVLGLRSRAVA